MALSGKFDPKWVILDEIVNMDEDFYQSVKWDHLNDAAAYTTANDFTADRRIDKTKIKKITATSAADPAGMTLFDLDRKLEAVIDAMDRGLSQRDAKAREQEREITALRESNRELQTKITDLEKKIDFLVAVETDETFGSF